MAASASQKRQVLAARRRAAAFCVLAGLLPLGIAFRLELHEGLAPCALCLWERWPYRALIACGVVGALLPRSFGRAAALLGIATMTAGIGLAGLHLGVERHWWPSPLAGCAAPRLPMGDPAGLLAALPAHAAKPCDTADHPAPGLPSLAGLGLGYQLAVLGMLALFAQGTVKAKVGKPTDA